MSIEIVPCSPALGAEIRGVDVSKVTDAEFATIIEAWHRYQVILLRNQNLPEEDQQVAFARRFGELAEVHVPEYQGNHPAVMYIGNLKEEGKSEGALPLGEMEFHIDQCYQQRPAKGTMLYAIEIPSKGGETVFANGSWPTSGCQSPLSPGSRVLGQSMFMIVVAMSRTGRTWSV